MHGIILSTIQQFAKQEYGREAWDAVQEGAGLDGTLYVPMKEYPDEHVYRLAESAGELTGEGARQFLVDYGRWVVEPLVETYNVHVDDSWNAMELIANVANFHAALRTHSLSNYTPPDVDSGWVEGYEGEVAYLDYDSPRQLCDVARGAFMGAADYYGAQINFAERECVFHGAGQCRFVIARVGSDYRVGRDVGRKSATHLSDTTWAEKGFTPTDD
jgi:predicted hydrocarbon binding protein